MTVVGGQYECPSGPQYFVSIAKASKTAGVPNMVVGNFVVAEKRQPEQKLGFCSDLGKKNPQPLSWLQRGRVPHPKKSALFTQNSS